MPFDIKQYLHVIVSLYMYSKLSFFLTACFVFIPVYNGVYCMTISIYNVL